MRYLVMECRPGYAVVLDDEGRFRKVVNLGYEVGQKIDSVVAFEDTLYKKRQKRIKQFVSLAVAACLCLVVMGMYQNFMISYGEVEMKINPDMVISVNKMDYVIGIEGLNQDGKTLLKDYSYRWKKINQVSKELADRAIDMGYLKKGGEIELTVKSPHTNWEKETEEKLVSDLTIYLTEEIEIEIIIRGPAEQKQERPEGSQTTPFEPGAGTKQEEADDDIYDSDDEAEDLEDDLEDEAEDIEDTADDLEDEAEDIEDTADDLEDEAEDIDDAADDLEDEAEDIEDAREERAEELEDAQGDSHDEDRAEELEEVWEDEAEDIDDAADDLEADREDVEDDREDAEDDREERAEELEDAREDAAEELREEAEEAREDGNDDVEEEEEEDKDDIEEEDD